MTYAKKKPDGPKIMARKKGVPRQRGNESRNYYEKYNLKSLSN